jgi:hypothetical protein
MKKRNLDYKGAVCHLLSNSSKDSQKIQTEFCKNAEPSIIKAFDAVMKVTEKRQELAQLS